MLCRKPFSAKNCPLVRFLGRQRLLVVRFAHKIEYFFNSVKKAIRIC